MKSIKFDLISKFSPSYWQKADLLIRFLRTTLSSYLFLNQKYFVGNLKLSSQETLSTN